MRLVAVETSRKYAAFRKVLFDPIEISCVDPTIRLAACLGPRLGFEARIVPTKTWDRVEVRSRRSGG